MWFFTNEENCLSRFDKCMKKIEDIEINQTLLQKNLTNNLMEIKFNNKNIAKLIKSNEELTKSNEKLIKSNEELKYKISQWERKTSIESKKTSIESKIYKPLWIGDFPKNQKAFPKRNNIKGPLDKWCKIKT